MLAFSVNLCTDFTYSSFLWFIAGFVRLFNIIHHLHIIYHGKDYLGERQKRKRLGGKDITGDK